jgi:hypothetical protein
MSLKFWKYYTSQKGISILKMTLSEFWRNVYVHFESVSDEIYKNMLKLGSLYILNDLDLYEMTFKDFGPHTLVSWNIQYQLHQFLMGGLVGMNSDGLQYDPPKFFGSIKMKIKMQLVCM